MNSPLRRWEIAGFRSILRRTTLELRNLNILVGANSAGKSSILQSLLLVSQSLSAERVERPLVLNGPFVQLGRPKDCIHESARTMELAFQLLPPRQYVALRSGLGGLGRGEDLRIAADFAFRPYRGAFETARAGFDISADMSRPGYAEPDREARLTFERRTKEDAVAVLRRHDLTAGSVKQAVSAGVQPVDVTPDIETSIIAASFNRLLPGPLFEDENVVESETRNLVNLLRRGVIRPADPRGAPPPSARRFRGANRPISTDARDVLDLFLRETVEGFDGLAPDTRSLVDVYDQIDPNELRRLGPEAFVDWYEAAATILPSKHRLRPSFRAEPFESAFMTTQRFFADGVRHIGPLREAPRPLYAMAQVGRSDWVGASGEFTAALLSDRKDAYVMCPVPDEDTSARIRLGAAVDLWLDHLGLSASVRSTERGKLGYGVDLKVEGVKARLDLTAVGVGVSQALPVIVQGLISPPGSLILCEQPELHLHPDTQAALADFLLRLAGTERQLIVETHSEYFISRLRRRVAEDMEDRVADLVRMFFVEREAGNTRVRPVEMNAYGSIPEWPEGFLDQAAHETEAIMRAMDAKRDRQSSRSS